MSNKQFISNLSATYADVRKLDVKKINLKGKNILEYIGENKTIVLDERGTNADDELDIWNSYVTKDENGNVIVNRNAKPKEHTYEEMTDEQKELLLNSAAQVIDNEVLDRNGKHLMYWQTDGLTDACYLVDENDDGETDMEVSVFCQNDLVLGSSSSSITTFSSDLSNLTSGSCMFQYCSALNSFNADLSSLTDGIYMFNECISLASFSSDLPNLTNGTCMFIWCPSLASFSSDLPNLTNGDCMFADCTALTSFNSDVSSLTNGIAMFEECSNLESFSSDLPSLTNGAHMFSSCYNLTTFNVDLSSLTEGGFMFYGCSQLKSFNSDLSSLTNGMDMFFGCYLDAPSVANIIHFLPQCDEESTITIGIGIINTDAAKQAFAEECDCDTWAELNKEFDDKNWAVEWQFNGLASYSLRDPRPSIAVYAKLEEVIMPTDKKAYKPHYQYTSQDGSKFYNIHWHHDSNTNNEGYDYFESLEEAITAYNVTPKN